MRLLYEHRALDLALLAVDTDRPPLPLATADRLREGLPVALIGNPGEFRDVLTLNAVPPGTCVRLEVVKDAGPPVARMRTTAFAVGGNSGGPAVCQATGQVVGVTTLRGGVDEGCPGAFLPADAVAAAVRVVGPPVGWDKRVAVQAARHAAAVTLDTLTGDPDRNRPGVRLLADEAAYILQTLADGKKFVAPETRRDIDAGDRLKKLHARLTAILKDARRTQTVARSVPAAPGELAAETGELVKQCESLTDLVGLPLRTSLSRAEQVGYFARLKTASADIEKRTAAVRKKLDDLDGK